MSGPSLDDRYLIVGGTTKAATTSLFFYLSEHPDVCAASMKEPRFFLDPDYPVRSSRRLGADDPEVYLDFFEHCGEEAVRLEATPSYLHSPGTAAAIRDHLPEARVTFLLREPVDRLVSWYRFALQDGMIPTDTSFRKFVEGQETGGDAEEPRRVMAQGRYAADLARYLDALGRERVYVGFFEEVKRDSAAVVAALCRFAGLDPAPLESLEYRVHNPTRPTRLPWLHGVYKRARYGVRQFTHDKPRLHALLRRGRAAFERVYWWMNEGSSRDLRVSASLRRDLREYYRPSVDELRGLIGTDLPEEWSELYGEGSG